MVTWPEKGAGSPPATCPPSQSKHLKAREVFKSGVAPCAFLEEQLETIGKGLTGVPQHMSDAPEQSPNMSQQPQGKTWLPQGCSKQLQGLLGF